MEEEKIRVFFEKSLTYLELLPPNDALFALNFSAALTYLPHGFEEKTKQFLICNWRIYLAFGKNFLIFLLLIAEFF